MGDVDGRRDINYALTRVRSEKGEERSKGLADLRTIIKENLQGPQLNNVKDGGYHTILETVFRVVKLESANLARASKTTKVKIESRLSACASLVRLVVDVALQKLRYKTVKAVVEHITQTLPNADAGYLEPLLKDYLKTLATVFDYKAHPEHFLGDEWRDAVEFCIDLAGDLNRTYEPDDSGFPNGVRSHHGSNGRRGDISRASTPSSFADHGRRPGKTASQGVAYPRLRDSDREVIICLRNLTSVSNAPIMGSAQKILTTLVELLRSYPKTSSIQQPALETINTVLFCATTNDISLAIQISNKVLLLFRQLWESKDTQLKEAMLEFLSYVEVLLPRMISEDTTGDCKNALSTIVEVMRDDYCLRRYRDQLQLEDISLPDPTTRVASQVPLSTKVHELRNGSLKAEHPWCLISSSAAMMVALEVDTRACETPVDADEIQVSAKRQRLTHPLDDVLPSLKGPLLPQKLYSLQMLVHVLDSLQFEQGALQTYLDALSPCLSDNDGFVTSWAMLAMASATGQHVARTVDFNDFWLQTWRLVARNITSTSTCRAACQLMAVLLESGLVQYTDVADLVDSMTRSIDLNGPAECDESATVLWSILLVLRGRTHLGSVSESCDIVLNWLFNRWSPSKLHDRQHASYVAHSFSAFSTLRLICLCLGQSISPAERQPALNLGLLSQARLKVLRDRKLMKYLLLIEDDVAPEFPEVSVMNLEYSNIKLSLSKLQTLTSTIVEFFKVEASFFTSFFFSFTSEDLPSLSTDSICISVTFCTIGYALLSSARLQDTRQKHQLENTLNDIRTGLKTSLQRHTQRPDLVKALCDTFGTLPLSISHTIGGPDLFSKGAIISSQGFDESFWLETRRTVSLEEMDDDQDPIEFDETFDSQRTGGRDQSSSADDAHLEVSAATNPSAFRACVVARICLMSSLAGSEDAGAAVRTITTSFVGYLTSLSPAEFFACRTFICEFLDSAVHIAEADASKLLSHLATMRGPYESERSEVSLGTTVDIMSRLAEIWTTTDDGEFAELGASLYSWFINIALGKGIASPHVLICISSMLQRIMKTRPGYAESLSLHSGRTSLFEVLRKGNIVVKFHIGNKIAEIFGLFVLTQHEKILMDVEDTLPDDQTWIEGIALRLFVLAHLAASWSTLLRRCVYRILECPGHIPESARHARNCLEMITNSLQLAKPQDLFNLFVSQILFTWLQNESLRSIPYTVLGYASFEDLLHDVQDDIVGQFVMRGKDDEAAQLAEDLEISFKDLLKKSFSKVSAYAIARDIAIPRPKDAQASEVSVRDKLGKELYTPLLVANFAKILALFFNIMNPDAQAGKGFQKHPQSGSAYTIYEEILANTGPEKPLPSIQEPSFKAKYLLDQINHLCRRTGYDAESLWSPTLYVYVFREVLHGIHPALGSLHACSILRRLRILICIAGTVALQDYPLEMALHAVKPYLTDPQCADEAIGILQYLIGHGAPYLQEVPSFLAGQAVSALTSMKAFFDSTQDSTTQESQFKATMSRAQAFHGWFASFLEGYDSSHLSAESKKCFKTIVKAASNIQTGGNARIGTYESDLLLELLEDQRSGRKLLDQSCKDTILKYLCTPFEVPVDFRDDVLGSDQQAALYALTVWETCQRDVCSPSYILWAGRVLGRAYAGKGLMDRGMIYETHAASAPNDGNTNEDSSWGSRTNILRLLYEMLLSDRSNQVGIAETALRSIVTRTDGTDAFAVSEQCLPSSLMEALLWKQYHLPLTAVPSLIDSNLQRAAAFDDDIPAAQWIQQLCISLALTAADDPILSELAKIVRSIEELAEKVFPYVLHLVLLRETSCQQTTKDIMSQAYKQWFEKCTPDKESTIFSNRILLEALLYLKTQPIPHETVQSDRFHWLKIDYRQAAAAAISCSMFKTALMFLEIDFSEALKMSQGAKASRRSSVAKRQEITDYQEPTDLLLEVYENIDEQDAFYGVQRPSSLTSMMARLEYEHAGFKSLSFRGAHYDGELRRAGVGHHADEESMVRALDNLDLNGLSQTLLGNISNNSKSAMDSMLRTARKLEQWDISAPMSYVSNASTVFKVFQNTNSATSPEDVIGGLNIGFAEAMRQIVAAKGAKSSMHIILGNLATLTELDEVFSSRRPEQLYEVLDRFKARDVWMYSESYDHIKNIMSCRETMFSMLSKKSKLQDMLKTSLRDARAVESRLLLASSTMSRLHGALQNALSTATYLNQLVKPCEEAGVDISAAVQLESANVLWGQGEMTASIRMLQDLKTSITSPSQLVRVGKPELLARLGHQISEARLEKPDEIINQYLTPAIDELHGRTDGDEAGQVFHEFASFCDQQLQNPDGLEDFQRIQKLRDRKEAEVKDMTRMMESKSSQSKERNIIKAHRDKAKQWFDLDNREYQRLRDSRQTFLRQSLENYLLCLQASNKYDNDVHRFSALWLENYDSEIANAAVEKHISQAGSRKFAALMNQWSSRLLNDTGHFQKLLASLVLRICIDHPYHGMYQIFMGSKTKSSKDDISLSRNAAAIRITEQLKAHKHACVPWTAIHNTNITFVRFAQEKLDEASSKQNTKVLLRKSPTGQRVEQDVLKQKVPPPTAKIELRADRDYSHVPFIARFQPEFTVAGGISAPKIVTAIGTDGKKYKQLFKGGNDDLRQDSIMEQVFEQVSKLLRSQRATRQRNLGIRTYKVLPLTNTAGIIEFVPNTIPLHDYLLPAHQRHFPKDLKPHNARKFVAEAQSRSADYRLEQYQKVCRQFRPVLRYFFTERFENPDDWFGKRLAYTRSTAAISILGHILGLGDRHGHNILLDERTGEVVHIDLGIAFEQGRVLAVPEIVPFRLTRDLVDGMGITKTEGVFRRCCEFTLDALRNESYSIMTILDVLRYDPLYSWSLSPLRLKKLQDAQAEDPRAAVDDGVKIEGGNGGGGGKKEEEGEAERALTVVKKKLSKSLSVQATVNELIQMATDERNLAVLFAGWAAWA